MGKFGGGASSLVNAIVPPFGPRAEDAWSEPRTQSRSRSQSFPGSPAGEQQSSRPVTASSAGTYAAEANRIPVFPSAADHVNSAAQSKPAQDILAPRSRAIDDATEATGRCAVRS